MSTFIWLENAEDIEPVANELSKSREEVKEILTGNLHNDKNSVFHTGTGDRRDLLKDTCAKYPRAYLERLFMEDLYDKMEIVWENSYGSVITTDDFVVFYLWAVINDTPYYQKFVSPMEDLVGVYHRTYDQQYREMLNRMVATIDLNAKVRRYGPMP